MIITPEQIVTLVRIAQKQLGLQVDGIFGPLTAAAIAKFDVALPPEPIAMDWYLLATRIPMHSTWHSGPMIVFPQAIVWHYTDTGPGTAITMARRRQQRRTAGDRPASWHISVEADGSLVQMAPFNTICWHAGGEGSLPIPNLGRANNCAIGIELVGYGLDFPPAQIDVAKKLCRALVRYYAIEKRYAMVQHSELNPTHRIDPGLFFMHAYAPSILEYAYA